ncbi:MAG: M14 family metallopeptidase, partial [Lysobacterales bacterium]
MRWIAWSLMSLLSASLIARSPPLSTIAERTAYRQTGRYDEVATLCADFARTYPGEVRCFEFGRTPEGRPLMAVVASRAGALTPEIARRKQLPVVLVQGGIHAGEIDGKDAGFLALRELLEAEADPGVLGKVIVLFVPVFNVDGHERFGTWNRPNQRGPERMGWRTTAQNYNLNRDYAKADAPEMRAMLALVDAWDPLIVVDFHVTDGAQFEHDVAIQVEPLNAGDEALRRIGRELRDGTIKRLEQQSSKPLPFYPSFVESDNPASGFVDVVAPPRFSTGYFWLRNRFAMLVETHSWKDYATRVRITRNTIMAVLDMASRNSAAWRREALAADRRATDLGGAELPLDFVATGVSRTLEFRGYAYTRTLSDVSGALMTRYDESKPQVWRIPLRDQIIAGTKVVAPRGGYIVPAAFITDVEPVLRAHGIEFSRVSAVQPQQHVQAFRADAAAFDTTSTEGHQRVTLQGQWRDETHDITAGALIVPIAQPKARLVHALFEPQGTDSFAAWGVFNNRFEQKEYMEAYVAEDIARAMLRDDPGLKAVFEQRLRDDPKFAADPAA